MQMRGLHLDVGGRQTAIQEGMEEEDLYSGYNDADDYDAFYGLGRSEYDGSQGFDSSSAYGGFDEGSAFDDRMSSYTGSQSFHGGPPSTMASSSLRSGSISMRKTPPPLTASTSGRPPGTASMRVPMSALTAVGSDGLRPMTSVKAAGYTSQPRPMGGRFDPLGQGMARGPAPPLQKKSEATPEEQCREMERRVNQLLEESAAASLAGESPLALEKAKEAGKRERMLCKAREQAGLVEQINVDLTYAICFNLAHQYHMNRLFSEALSTFTLIVKNKQFSQAGRLRVNMGNIYYQQRKFPQAIKMYRMALDQIPNTSKDTRWKIMRNIGNAFMRLGQYQDAVQSYEAIVESNGGNHQAGYNLILCYYALGEREKLKRGFVKLISIRHYESDNEDELDPEPDSVLRDDGLKDEMRARQKQALKYIGTAARLVAPEVGEKSWVEGYDWVVECLNQGQHVALAHELEMEKALQHLHRRDLGQAIALLKEFEKKEQSLRARAATNLSFLYFLENEIENAEKHAELAVRTDRYNARALVNRGNCLYLQGDVEGARALYLEAVGVEADCIEAMYNLGLANKRLGALADSLSVFRKINALLPDNVEVVFQIASVYDGMGNAKQAIKWFKILNSSVAHDPGVLARLGSIHSRFDDEANALHYYTESHRVYPVNMDVISWLGAFHVKGEVYEKAMPFFDLASQIQPTEVKWQLMVASCYRRVGAYPMALAKYKEIHRLHPDNVECLRYLVHICSDLNRKDELHEYMVKLRKAERAAAQESAAAQPTGLSPPHTSTSSPRPAGDRTGSASLRGSFQGEYSSGGRMASSPDNELMEATTRGGVSIEEPLSSPSPLPQRGGGKMVRTGKRDPRSDEDEWGGDELGDDLLPM